MFWKVAMLLWLKKMIQIIPKEIDGKTVRLLQ